LNFKTLFKFDEKGNKTEESRYDINGNLVLDVNYKYDYDDKGNWIRKIKFENEIPEYILEREIEYYEKLLGTSN